LQAIPILNDALAALNTITDPDIAYIKKLSNPPAAIKLVLKAVCVVLDIKPNKVRLSQHTVLHLNTGFTASCATARQICSLLTLRDLSSWLAVGRL
jgi:hypothetical protein